MTETADSVSVVIPTYNRRDALLAAVESALAQTHAVLEVLVCDDGSDDGTAEAVRAHADARVRWIDCGRHGRPAPPRNRGIAEAKGRWVAFLDDDDRWMPQKLQKQLLRGQAGVAVAVSCNATRVDADGQEHGPLHAALPETLGLADLVKSNWVITSGMLARRERLAVAGGFPEAPDLKALEDYALWLRLAATGPIAVVEECLLFYRDAPAESIRAQGAAVALRQRSLVFGNWMRWSWTEILRGRFHGSALLRSSWTRFKVGIRSLQAGA